MNGATAEPLVRTINPPKTAMTMNTGRSQNFLRTRRKAQNSRRKLTIDASELVLECFGCRAGRLADDPIAVRRGLECSPHRVLAGEPHQKSDRGDADIEQDPEEERADDQVQQQAEFCPEAVERRENAWRGAAQHCEQGGERQPVVPARAALIEAQRAEQREKSGKSEAEAALGRELDDLVPSLELVSAEIPVCHPSSPVLMASQNCTISQCLQYIPTWASRC